MSKDLDLDGGLLSSPSITSSYMRLALFSLSRSISRPTMYSTFLTRLLTRNPQKPYPQPKSNIEKFCTHIIAPKTQGPRPGLWKSHVYSRSAVSSIKSHCERKVKSTNWILVPTNTSLSTQTFSCLFLKT